MQEAQYGVMLGGNTEIVDVSDMLSLESYLNENDIHSYLICAPRPYADMICQQARTGQPVYVRYTEPTEDGLNMRWRTIKTNTPDWNIPGAEYRLTPFED